MRRIVVALLGTVSGLVMLFSYHTSTHSGSTAIAGTGGTNGAGTGSSGTGSSGSTSSGTGSTSSGSSGAGSTATTTYQGDSVRTRWGPVQVAIQVSAGTIVGVDAIDYPTDNPRDQEINSYAIPALNQAVMDAQSANIDMISGATVTSEGYLTSLQSALDAAHL